MNLMNCLSERGVLVSYGCPVPFLHVFYPRTHRDNATDPFCAHDRRQLWPITITASDQ